ncbi:MAG: Rrf2 family transcriptional regulator [Chloroflexi bacterium]|nr:Rrf2 family transcriptional regulator [Chloroflexota bacterium]
MENLRRSAPVGPSWFAVAVQALAKLARNEGLCPSAEIASEVQTHAVFLRRVLAQLARAGMVEAREGRDGGYQLARPASEISLGDVHRALSAASPIPVTTPFNATCAGSPGMQHSLDEIRQEAEAQLVQVLDRYTIAGLLARVERRASAT